MTFRDVSGSASIGGGGGSSDTTDRIGDPSQLETLLPRNASNEESVKLESDRDAPSSPSSPPHSTSSQY